MGSHIRNVIWHLWLRIVQYATGGSLMEILRVWKRGPSCECWWGQISCTYRLSDVIIDPHTFSFNITILTLTWYFLIEILWDINGLLSFIAFYMCFPKRNEEMAFLINYSNHCQLQGTSLYIQKKISWSFINPDLRSQEYKF